MTDMAVPEQREFEYTSAERRKVVAAAGLGWGLEFFDLMLVSLLVTRISDDFGISLSTIGVVFSAQLVATAIGGVLFGQLADRFGRARVLSWTIWVFGLGSIACAAAPNLAVFLVLRVVTGLGVGGEWAVGFSLLNEAWSPKRRGLAGGAVQGAIWPAYALAIFVTGAVPHWRWAFVIGVLPVLAAIWVRHSCPESHQWKALKAGTGTGRRTGRRAGSLRELFTGSHLKTVVLGTVVVFGAQYSYYVYSSWMPTYLKEDLGVSPADAQTILYVSAVIALISYVASGALGDRVGRRSSLLIFAVIQLVGFLAFAALNIGDGATSLLVVSYFVISFGLGYFGIFGAWFGELFATSVRSSGSSFCYSVGRGFASAGPLLVGVLAGSQGLGVGISTGIVAVLIMMGFSLLLADRSGRVITAAD